MVRKGESYSNQLIAAILIFIAASEFETQTVSANLMLVSQLLY